MRPAEAGSHDALSIHSAADGMDAVLLTREGAPFSAGGLSARVKAITRKWVGKALLG